MARFRVMNVGIGLQIWTVVVTYAISSRAQPTRGGHPAWRLDGGQTTPHHKKQLVTKCYIGS
jgi:hypothetical protein